MNGQENCLDRNRCALVLSNGTYFVEIYPMAKKADEAQVMKMFLMKLSVPEKLMVDRLKEHKFPGNEFMKCCQKNNI